MWLLWKNFYNIILKVESIFEPNEMLGACLGIEAGFGRLRTVRFGPRIIDIDIIFAENEKMIAIHKIASMKNIFFLIIA